MSAFVVGNIVSPSCTLPARCQTQVTLRKSAPLFRVASGGGSSHSHSPTLSLSQLPAGIDADIPREPLRNVDPDLINDDLAPTLASARSFSTLDVAALWIGIVICIPTFMLSGSLVALGMNWWQAILTVGLANTLVLFPMFMNGHPGTKYGIPFPVLARSSFGIRGAHIPSLLRALVGVGWFGIQTWVGGAALLQFIDAFCRGVLTTGAIAMPLPLLGISLPEFAAFMAFWFMQVYVLLYGMDAICTLEKYCAPVLVGTGLLLLGWAWNAAGGMSSMLSIQSQFSPGMPKAGMFWPAFISGLTANFGYWATLSLNIPDFTRFCKSQKDQIVGQALGLPTSMILFAFIGVAVTSATSVIFGETISDPSVIVSRIGSGWVSVLSIGILLVATLTTNIAANIVAPTNALMSLSPTLFNFKRAVLVTCSLAVLLMPWKLMQSTNGFIFTWLIGYSALLGPIGGILGADYFMLKNRTLDLPALYRKSGPYWYSNGYNYAALWALVLGVLPNIPGFLHTVGFVSHVPAIFLSLYSCAWLVGFLVSATSYYVMMKTTHAQVSPSPPASALPHNTHSTSKSA
eukprot:TRINITY_DN15816_c0_g1::TRINITY_DN15816_c0_g1_i1::g.25610::m.25610 TRINITY_DN15816_c0_g1::TRINITY_DN15816_c0_g1_i1::g.25610  ORF type:complete len:587 (+),score=99.76,sp/Q9LZD0/NCS1_ARATH/50.42/1e-146,Transp_cyt_pur/PF02133.10/2.7e-101 TRINITY_DN15816_c0_g1_i1:41-1762(+)